MHSMLERLTWEEPHLTSAELEHAADYLLRVRLPHWTAPDAVPEQAGSHLSRTTSHGGASWERTSQRSSWRSTDTTDRLVDGFSTATSPLRSHSRQFMGR